MKKMLVLNFVGGPGAGKSSLSTAVFSQLKFNGVNSEYASEFAKDLTWENRKETLTDQLYLFAKQNHKLHRLEGKVDVAVTDCPLILSAVYNQKYLSKNSDYDIALEKLILEQFNIYNNKVYFIERTKKYNPSGRNQSEDEAKEFDTLFLDYLTANKIPYEIVHSTEEDAKRIAREIIHRIQG